MSYIPNPALRAEKAILYFASSSLAGQNLIDPATEWFTGESQSDKEGPAVVIACNSATETYSGQFCLRVYRFDVDVMCKQIAWDSTTSSALTSSMINLAGNVHALFGDTFTSSLAFNNCIASGSNDFFVYYIDCQGFENQRVEDAWISNMKLEVIGKLCLSTSQILANTGNVQ